MTPPNSSDTHQSGGADTPSRLDELRARLETAGPAAAREAVRELMLPPASGDRDEALKLAVRFSRRTDYSTDDLLRLWSTVDGDPDGFCADLLAPAHCARKAVKKLVSLSEPGDDGEPLKLAARFTGKDKYAAKLLLQLWKTVSDPDGFAEHLLAPTFRHEGRTALRLEYVDSLTGLRHLTMLDKLRFDSCEEITDLTEVGELTGLTDLEFWNCKNIEDLTPIRRLTGLTRLDLGACGAVEDIEPLLNLHRLRELKLFHTGVRSARGFGAAFPVLESLDLRFCKSFADVEGLMGLRSLTRLSLSDDDRVRDLSPFAALSSLESLSIENFANLTTLEGLGTHPRLAKLTIDRCDNLRSPEGLGRQPALQEVRLMGRGALIDLRGLGRLPALRTVFINGTGVSNLDGLAGSPLSTLTLLYMDALDSLSSLRECDGLKELTIRDCPRVADDPVLGELKENGVTVTDRI